MCQEKKVRTEVFVSTEALGGTGLGRVHTAVTANLSGETKDSRCSDISFVTVSVLIRGFFICFCLLLFSSAGQIISAICGETFPPNKTFFRCELKQHSHVLTTQLPAMNLPGFSIPDGFLVGESVSLTEAVSEAHLGRP